MFIQIHGLYAFTFYDSLCCKTAVQCGLFADRYWVSCLFNSRLSVHSNTVFTVHRVIVFVHIRLSLFFFGLGPTLNFGAVVAGYIINHRTLTTICNLLLLGYIISACCVV